VVNGRGRAARESATIPLQASHLDVADFKLKSRTSCHSLPPTNPFPAQVPLLHGADYKLKGHTS
jgi:hypothetical protein